MVTRSDIELLVRARNHNTGMAQRRLAEAFKPLPMDDPWLVRDALLEVVPALVFEHGDIAAAATADWYEQMRAREVPGAYRALTGDDPELGQIEGSVRFAAGELFGGDPATTLRLLEGSIQRLIKYQEDATFRANALADPTKPRFAIVPRPPMTCAFCDMLASRGWVYHSPHTAGAHTNRFHDHCDCMIVPSWDAQTAHITGYDPDALYDRYMNARAEVEATGAIPDDGNVSRAMERQNPALYAPANAQPRTSSGAGNGKPPRNRPPRLGSSDDPGDGWNEPRQVPQPGGIWGSRPEQWLERQTRLHSATNGEALHPHEIEFLERLEQRGERVAWIPGDRVTHVATNDFYWLTNGGVAAELKSTRPKYSTIKEAIRDSVISARENQSVVKDVFVIDLGKYRLAPKLETQLRAYNQRGQDGHIKRLFVMSDNGAALTEIDLD